MNIIAKTNDFRWLIKGSVQILQQKVIIDDSDDDDILVCQKEEWIDISYVDEGDAE